MSNKYVIIKKNDFRGENLFLQSLYHDSDEQVFDVECDESFLKYSNEDFKENCFIFEEGIDFEIYKKKVGNRSVKDANGIPYDFHTYYQNFAKLK